MTATTFLTWLGANATTLGAGAADVALLIAALRAHEWRRLIATAGQLALMTGRLAGLDNRAKRQQVEIALYETLPAWARRIFTQQEVSHAVEIGYRTIAQPSLDETTAEPARLADAVSSESLPVADIEGSIAFGFRQRH